MREREHNEAGERTSAGATAPSGRPVVQLFTRPGCHLCERARDVLEHVREERPFELVERDIDAPGEQAARARYRLEIPVVEAPSGAVLRWPFTAAELRAALGPPGA